MIRYELKAITTAYTVDGAYDIYYGAWSLGFGIRNIIFP